MAYIFRRRNKRGKLVGNWRLGYEVGTSRHQITLKTKSRTAAAKLLAKFILERDRVVVGGRPRIAVSEAVKQFLDEHDDLHPSTVAWYRRRLEAWRKWLEVDPQLSEVSTNSLRKYRRWRERDHQPRTVAGDMRTLRAFFNWAFLDAELLDRSPLNRKTCKVPRIVRAARVALSREEREQYERKLRGMPLFVLYMFGCYAGLRLSEIANLERSDIRNGEIVVQSKPQRKFTVKDYEARRLPIEAELLPVIERLPSLGPAVPSPRGKFSNASELGRRWRAAMQLLKLPPIREGKRGVRFGVTSHELRYTYASVQIQERGVDIEALRDQLGHSSIVTSQIYLKHFKPLRKPVRDAGEQPRAADDGSTTSGSDGGVTIDEP